MDLRGAYPADRAAALSGVPLSTVHYWARTGVVRPSVSAERIKHWSFADLLSLRTIHWLRHEKEGKDGVLIPPTSMQAVRKALGQLQELSLDLFAADGDARLVVEESGQILVRQRGELADLSGQGVLDVLEQFAPFPTLSDLRGPNLQSPRPHLRIVPGKLSGEPHVEDTRLETQALAAFRMRGASVEDILTLYPFVDAISVEEALDLEDQLNRNVQLAAA